MEQLASLDDVQLFVQVVRSGGFSAAARKLGLPKSTVSRRITDLEEVLAARLLERTTRKLSLTELGSSLFERASTHIDNLADATRSIVELDEKPRGLLRVTAPSDPQIARLITKYQKLNPLVRIVLHATPQRLDLIEEGYDIAIRAGDLPDSSLIARQLAVSHRWLIASQEYLDQAPPLEIPEDLKRHVCLAHSTRQTETEYTLMHGDETMTIPVDGVFAANSMELLLGAAMDGQGIALLPEGACRLALERGWVVRVLPQYQSPPTPIYAVYPSSRLVTPKVRSFIDFMQREMQSAMDHPPTCPEFKARWVAAPPPSDLHAPQQCRSR